MHIHPRPCLGLGRAVGLFRRPADIAVFRCVSCGRQWLFATKPVRGQRSQAPVPSDTWELLLRNSVWRQRLCQMSGLRGDWPRTAHTVFTGPANDTISCANPRSGCGTHQDVADDKGPQRFSHACRHKVLGRNANCGASWVLECIAKDASIESTSVQVYSCPQRNVSAGRLSSCRRFRWFSYHPEITMFPFSGSG